MSKAIHLKQAELRASLCSQTPGPVLLTTTQHYPAMQHTCPHFRDMACCLLLGPTPTSCHTDWILSQHLWLGLPTACPIPSRAQPLLGLPCPLSALRLLPGSRQMLCGVLQSSRLGGHTPAGPRAGANEVKMLRKVRPREALHDLTHFS